MKDEDLDNLTVLYKDRIFHYNKVDKILYADLNDNIFNYVNSYDDLISSVYVSYN